MPWRHEWIEPELAFTVYLTKASTPEKPASIWPYYVYHVYKDDNAAERLCYWYTLHDGRDPDGTYTEGDLTQYHFDIRDVPTYDPQLEHEQILQRAVQSGLCTIEDCFIYFDRAHPTPETTQ